MSDVVTLNIKETLNGLFSGEQLSKKRAKAILTAVGKGQVNPHQTTALLTCFQMRPITGEELAGFREAMIDLALHIDISDLDAIDMCGTGGDGKDTFNISTTSSFVVAGAGYKVAKHGNVGVSSNCGSSNVLEHLGYQMTNDYDKLRACLDRANFCYMHAPLFHPAMRHVGAIRRGLGVKTFFNMLGPLLNPAKPNHQLTGVFSTKLLPLYKAVFEDMGIRYATVHSLDVYDEISLTSPFEVRSNEFDGVLTPEDLGLKTLEAKALKGGATIADSAEILTNVLSGRGTPAQETAVCANAGFAIQQFKPNTDIKDCVAEARASIASGKAMQMLKNLVG
ncbi:MAG: anthranilate phosphoribosyltransferase [Bacteroidota bacterium]